jgi:two-component system chemotaxis sensor kinase CheA
MDPALLLNELRDLGKATIVPLTNLFPSFADFNPTKCYLGWNITLETRQDVDAVWEVFIFVRNNSRIEITDLIARFDLDLDSPLPRLGDILVDRGDVERDDIEETIPAKIGQRLIDAQKTAPANVESSLNEQTAISRRQEVTKKEFVRVSSEKLDALINLVGELVTNQAHMAQVANEVHNVDLDASVEASGRLVSELRDVALNVRMMPIGTLFGQYKRLVRDLSKDLGKEVELVTEGEETELDKTVIDRLGEQLVHLIRNCVDHGIESPDQREERGKSRRGAVRLCAFHRGASVIIQIQDDGRGLDTKAIHERAVEKGVVPAEREMTEKEIYSLIFSPGLSTAEKITDISGRGVGMDAVRKGIEALRGSINVSSEFGKGTVIELSLPLTLAIIDGLLVEVNKDHYVIPLSQVEECLEMTDDKYVTGDNRNLMQMRGGIIPLIRLRQMFYENASPSSFEEVVVVGIGEMRVGLVVDHIIGNNQTVIKSLGDLYRNSQCASGATIMGDGSVALILDVAEIIKLGETEEKECVAHSAA